MRKQLNLLQMLTILLMTMSVPIRLKIQRAAPAFQHYKRIYQDFPLANFDLSALHGASPSQVVEESKDKQTPPILLPATMKNISFTRLVPTALTPQTGKQTSSRNEIIFL